MINRTNGQIVYIFCFVFHKGFVLIITIVREAVEEMRCFLRDKEVNSQIYSKLSTRGEPLFPLIKHFKRHTPFVDLLDGADSLCLDLFGKCVL